MTGTGEVLVIWVYGWTPKAATTAVQYVYLQQGQKVAVEIGERPILWQILRELSQLE